MQVSPARLLWSYGFVLGPNVCEIFYVPPRVESLFLPVLWSSCTQVLLTFKSKCSWDSSSQWQSLAREPDIGIQTLTVVWEPLWYYYFPASGSSTQHIWDWIMSWKYPSYHFILASSFCLNVKHHFVGSSLVNCHSMVSCVFVFCDSRWVQGLLLCCLLWNWGNAFSLDACCLFLSLCWLLSPWYRVCSWDVGGSA